jgi:hypothetical protein
MIGLEETNTIDSIKVRWPSGLVDRIYQLESNQTIIIREGSTGLPPKIYASDSTIICEGDSLALETGFYQSYLWSNGEKSRKIYAKESGEYSLQVINQQGRIACSDTLIIQVLPVPEITFQTTPSDYNQFNGTIRAQVSGGLSPYNYLWSSSGRDTSFIAGVGPGTHSLIVTDQNGCQRIQSVEVELVTGLSMKGERMTFFPNPIQDLLFMETGEAVINEPVKLALWTFAGKFIESSEIIIKDRITLVPFQFHKLPPGFYILQFSNKNQKKSLRIIIK